MTSLTADDLIALAREIASRMAPDSLLSSEDVGALLKCSSRYVNESVSLAPGFPKASGFLAPTARAVIGDGCGGT